MEGTNIYWFFVSLGRELHFSVYLGTRPVVPIDSESGGQQVLENLDTVSPLLLCQRDLFDILVSESISSHRELYNYGKSQPTFHPVDLVIVSK